MLLILAAVIIIWIAVYTFSFAVWTWKKGNKFGAFTVMCMALLAVLLPVLNLFIL